VVSHELRSPLNGIRSWAYVLENQLADGPQPVQRALAGIRTGVAQQVRLIEDLLDATRVMSGKLRLTRQPFALRMALERALGSVRAQATERHITLHETVLLGTQEINGDADRIQQIVWNLLANAIKFTQEGGDVWLTAEVSGDVARIVVRDNGRGIAPAFVPHLFDPFYRVTGDKPGPKGLGLGLAVVKGLVEAHDGRVWAENRAGGGARFGFAIPTTDPPAEIAVSDEAAVR